MTAEPRILVAGIGNIFLGDDAFGVEVVRRLVAEPWPPGVRVVDFGIRGMDLIYALLEPWDAALLIDAVPRGLPPGTLSVIEPEIGSDAEPDASLIEAHSMNPVKVLRTAAAMGASVRRLLILGCEPSPWTEDEMRMELSDPVRAALDEAVSMTREIVRSLQGGRPAPGDPQPIACDTSPSGAVPAASTAGELP